MSPLFAYITELPSLEVDVLEEGSAVVYCDKLLTVLRSCPDEELLFESVHTDFNVTLKNNDSLFYTLKMTLINFHKSYHNIHLTQKQKENISELFMLVLLN